MASIMPFGSALILSIILMPIMRHIGLKIGRVSLPRDDRWHKTATPTLGGVGIFLAFLGGLLISVWIVSEKQSPAWGFLLGSGLMFLVGIYDEFKPLSPAAKLIGQILAATVVIMLGFTSTFFSPRIENPLLAQGLNILFTYVWLIGITNAINLLDNMDGLAGGISLITSLILGYFFWRAGNLFLLWTALALAGSLLGFLFFNFPPASIFMGDSGSLFLGFTLAVMAIAHQQQASDVLAVLTVPTLVFLLPIVDTAMVTFTRILRGQSPIRGGRDHTSHRLIAFGLTEKQTLFILYGVAILAAVLAASLESINYSLSLLAAPLILVILALLAAYLGGVKVVETANSGKPDTAITRIMLELTYRRRVFEVVLDFFLIGISYYLTFLITFGLGITNANLELYLRSLPLVVAITYLSFFIFGVYRGVWRYIDLNDLLHYFLGSLGSVLILLIGLSIVRVSGTNSSLSAIPFWPLIIYGFILFLSVSVSRSSFKILDRVFKQQTRNEEQSVLIIGAGDAGEMALRWMMMNSDMNYHPVGFLDQDPFKAGRQIHGVQVLGDVNQLENILQHRQVKGVILAGLNKSEIDSQIIEICRKKKCWVRNLRLEFELIE